MKCPECENQLEEGAAHLRGTLTGFIFMGLSHMELFFRKGLLITKESNWRQPDPGNSSSKDDKSIMQPHHWYEAYHCGKCKIIVSRYRG